MSLQIGLGFFECGLLLAEAFGLLAKLVVGFVKLLLLARQLVAQCLQVGLLIFEVLGLFAQLFDVLIALLLEGAQLAKALLQLAHQVENLVGVGGLGQLLRKLLASHGHISRARGRTDAL